jgi:hypothetical protein
VTGLSVTHEVATVGNKLIISAFFGAAANSFGRGDVGIAVNDGSAFVGTGDVAGNRVSVSAGGRISGASDTVQVGMPSVTFVHTPSAGSKTYTVHAFNMGANVRNLFINRSEADTDSANFPRTASALVIQEVAV